jgi:hypothetical protein
MGMVLNNRYANSFCPVVWEDVLPGRDGYGESATGIAQ